MSTSTLPIDIIPVGQTLYRIHRSHLDPIFFGPQRGQPPVYRFDSGSGRFGVLYVGLGLKGAFAETLLRNPQRLMVSHAAIDARAVSEMQCDRALRVVRLYGTGLQQVGTDNAISTGPYDICGLWTDAFWDHSDQPDGIAYSSRHDPSEFCLALFDRGDMGFLVNATTTLMSMQKELGAMLDLYGKSIAPRP
ncbi:RES family NAD+ phosphorylase [Devosia sp. UYZn731]|uniref:RES family NAD+ phosphorylase n=1 Tax=Devosia sp. UYZn731 TaxID=3156345 RepID=UPI00339821E5